MAENILGKSEQQKSPQEFGKPKNNKLWVFVLLVIIIIAGYFVYKKYSSRSVISPPQRAEENSKSVQKSDNISDLQAATVNIAIPDFSKNF